jgi:hypothetical protein
MKANMSAMKIQRLECYLCNHEIQKKEIKSALSVKSRFRSFLSFITT